jgi:pyruvate/2-oxoglutarate dehydrogenase complex dihydrolipoamide dehydrogenase (E3) component
MDAVSAYSRLDEIGYTAVIIGGGEIGVELGMHLAQNGRKATVLEMTGTFAADCTPTHYRSLFIRAWNALSDNLALISNAKVVNVEEGSVTYVDAENNSHALAADTIVLAAGLKSRTDEALSTQTQARPSTCLAIASRWRMS